jgi:RimJ/RimL family protein N-acetyltransferase
MPNLQPTLQNHDILLRPLAAGDFETLYAVASDPLIWEQHPNSDRYRREVFENFFEEAIASGGAFLILDKKTGAPIGSSRFYEYNPETDSIAIGFTFLARAYWGTAYNKGLKKLMTGYAFTLADHVLFHVGERNFRSQKALEKLGIKKMTAEEREQFMETDDTKVVYLVRKSDQLLFD